MKAKRNLMIGLVVLLVVLAVGVLAAQTVSDRDAAASASEDTSIALTSLTASSEIESFGYTWQGDTLNFEQRQEVVETESDSRFRQHLRLTRERTGNRDRLVSGG